MPSTLNTPIQFVKGVGPYLAEVLAKKEIRVVKDLLFNFPLRYLDRRSLSKIRELTPGKEKCFTGSIVTSLVKHYYKRRVFEIHVSDSTGVATLTFFHFNEKFLKKKYPDGKKVLVFGECQFFGSSKQFVHPEIEDWDDEAENHSALLLPVYALTEGLYQKTIRKITLNALHAYAEAVEEVPLTVRADSPPKITLKEAILAIHTPPVDANLLELNDHVSAWHKRIIYDELFYLQLGLGRRKQKMKQEMGFVMNPDKTLLPQAVKLLPFELTNAQKRVIGEIEADLGAGKPMNRLVQGDVGSGKTMVAFLSALTAIASGFQVALMAPTEILAEQHFKNLKIFGDQLKVNVAHLSGSTPKKEREVLLENLKSGKINLLIGTHALIQEDVDYHRLGLAIIDEQHRFGVMQRAMLKSKSSNTSPHILIMTATPIPRTLSMTLYSDLDVSVIDELPKGRKPITTNVFYENKRGTLYQFVRQELTKGRQAYFVYPLIEESEKVDLKNAMTMAKNLAEVFKEYKVAVLHGKMKPVEKEEVMKSFKENKTQILVSTTVIEVGVDVPNASVMVIEHAERFGLSQLHQLRGRVGRGGEQSYCILVAGYAQSEETRYRLSVMAETTDGFKIAEEDLKLRGPGDFIGTRQSGLPDFEVAYLIKEGKLLEMAKKRSTEILEFDPELEKPEHEAIKRNLADRWGDKLSLADVS